MPGEFQGTEGWKNGNLRRYLPSVAVFTLDSTTAQSADVQTRRLWLTGLSANLRVQVSCGAIRNDDGGNNDPFVWPAGGGSMQIYPVTKFPDIGQRRIFLRPVFQDPTNTTNTNAPLAQELPFGWEGEFTLGDDLMIEVSLDGAIFFNTQIDGQVIVQVAVEYNGAWWDIEAISKAMGKVNLQGVSMAQNFGTGGGG